MSDAIDIHMHELLQVLQNTASLDLLKEGTELRAENQAIKEEVEGIVDKFRTMVSELEEVQHEGRRVREDQHDMIQALETRVREQTVLLQTNQEKIEKLEEVIGDLKAKLKR
ncbi:hypothetical protein ACHAWO_011660 [Cyclotella atomus]|uniref:Uncharacterized protein n=1 Tax=Cyclotella atomus TaxID=382360 RepID=A0ABD3PQJ6_9STRA